MDVAAYVTRTRRADHDLSLLRRRQPTGPTDVRVDDPSDDGQGVHGIGSRVHQGTRQERVPRQGSRQVSRVSPRLAPCCAPARQLMSDRDDARVSEEMTVDQPLLTVDRQMGLVICTPDGKVRRRISLWRG